MQWLTVLCAPNQHRDTPGLASVSEVISRGIKIKHTSTGRHRALTSPGSALTAEQNRSCGHNPGNGASRRQAPTGSTDGGEWAQKALNFWLRQGPIDKSPEPATIGGAAPSATTTTTGKGKRRAGQEGGGGGVPPLLVRAGILTYSNTPGTKL
ncbi:hypothetical protein GWK47_019286 [Chionoecetes opilio]|uniref:Uncharacterized protein n=1 Tax=Chionoecetes opilio TaxID=41210 RepID=A0A8J4XQC1_CHIOP|nr:hypothetical protein GWK47_019286 [Chionoecetes opilio]